MQQRLPSQLDRPIAFAHRGARAHARENTLEAFALALKLGATGLESDVWVTLDGIAVLDHDGVVRSGLRKHPISTLRRDQLPSHIPSLSELLRHCGDGYHLSLDIKDEQAAPVVITTVRTAAPDLLPRLWLCHPSWTALAQLRRSGGPDAQVVKLVDSTRLSRIKEGPERRAATLAQERIDAINLHHSDWNGGLVALVHRFELVAFGWDLQFDHQLRPALRMGLDGVYSDWVDRMIDSYRAELGTPQV